jgi:hypothetical protein
MSTPTGLRAGPTVPGDWGGGRGGMSEEGGRRPAPKRRVKAPRQRTAILVAGAVLLGGILVALLTPPRPVGGYLNPASPGGQGTRALAQILGRRGQPVTAVTSAAAAQEAVRDAAGRHPGLVLTSPYLLTQSQLTALVRLHTNLLVVEPDSRSLAALAALPPAPAGAGRTAYPGTTVAGTAAGQAAGPGCPLPAAQAAGSAVMGGVLMRDTAAGAWQCYRVDGHPSLVRYQSAGRSVTLLGSGAPLTNAGLASRGDAALALNLLAGSRQIVWLVPGPPAVPGAASPAAPKSLLQEIPRPAYLVTLQVFLAVALAALWRIRRLGPLVTEPLPVVVRASETVEGHGRLYRSRHSRDRVAAVLRTAATRRITTRLALPATADPDAVCAAVSARTGREPARLREVLFGPVPRDDAALVALGRDIDAVEEEVRTH